MNIKDSVIPEQKGDMLEEIFERQMELLTKYIPIERENGRFIIESGFGENANHNWDHPKTQAFFKEEIFRVVVELVEAADCLKNKPWKQYHVETDVPHFLEELIDAFHFMIELFIWVGMDARKLRDAYFGKAEVNKFRQRSNY